MAQNLCGLPIIFWLKNPPVDVYLFAQLALIESIIFAISMPLTTAARAPGKMKLYELTLGAMQLLDCVESGILGFYCSYHCECFSQDFI